MFCFECWRNVVRAGVLVKLTFVETLLEICLWSMCESIQRVVYQNSYTERIEEKANFVFFPMVFNISSQKVTCSEHSSLEPGRLLSSMKEIVFQFEDYCIYTRWVLNMKIMALSPDILYCVLVKQRWKADLTSIPKTDFISIRNSSWCFVTNLFYVNLDES